MLDREFGWKERTAQNFIQVFEASKSAKFADLTVQFGLSFGGIEAEAKHKAAAASVEDARGQHARAVAHAAASGTPRSATTSMREARAAELDAEDELDAARAAVETLRTELDDLEDIARGAENRVAAAVNAVIAPVAAQMLEDMKAAESGLIVRNAVLHSLLAGEGKRAAPDDWRGQKERDAPLVDVRDRFRSFCRRSRIGDDDDYARAAAAAKDWDGVREALASDPFAATLELLQMAHCGVGRSSAFGEFRTEQGRRKVVGPRRW